MTLLETTNLHCFTYKTDDPLMELLGGIRIDTLGRMRVTMKVTVINRNQAELSNPELAGLEWAGKANPVVGIFVSILDLSRATDAVFNW